MFSESYWKSKGMYLKPQSRFEQAVGEKVKVFCCTYLLVQCKCQKTVFSVVIWLRYWIDSLKFI